MRKSEFSKEKILAAAEEEFSQKGLFGARIDSIALSAGINKRMLYAYFGNKEELYSATLKTVYSRLADVEKKVTVDADPETAIRNYIETYFEFLINNPTFVKLIIWENLNEGRFIEAVGAAVIKSASINSLKKIFNDGRKSGIFKSTINDEEFIYAINMFCFSYFSNRYTMPLLLKTSDDIETMKQRSQFVSDIIIDKLKK